MRTLIAGVVGGLILFLWGAVSHTVLPLGHMGFSRMAPEHEEVVYAAMKLAMTERKIYFFPGVDMDDKAAQESEPYKSRYASGPTGIVAFSPGPGLHMDGKTFATEFAFNVLESLIAALVVGSLAASTSYGKRVLLVGLIGLSGTLAVDGSHWNWYRFPTEFFGAQVVMAVVGALLAGLAIAKLVPAPKP